MRGLFWKELFVGRTVVLQCSLHSIPRCGDAHPFQPKATPSNLRLLLLLLCLNSYSHSHMSTPLSYRSHARVEWPALNPVVKTCRSGGNLARG